MADEQATVLERGVFSAPTEVWDAAARRAEVIGRLARADVVGLEAADVAATKLGLSRRQVYALLRRWRAGEGVVTDLTQALVEMPATIAQGVLEQLSRDDDGAVALVASAFLSVLEGRSHG